METLMQRHQRVLAYLFFLLTLIGNNFAFDGFADAIPAVEKSALMRSLKNMNVHELQILLQDNINQGKPAEYSFIIVDELLTRNSTDARSVVKEFFTRPLSEITKSYISAIATSWYPFAEIRHMADGDEDKLAVLFGEKMNRHFSWETLWLLADLYTPKATQALKNLPTKNTHQLSAKEIALLINQNLPADKFVSSVLQKVKACAKNYKSDFKYEEWAFSRYQDSEKGKNKTEAIVKCLQDELANYENQESAGHSDKLYADFIAKTIKRGQQAIADDYAFNEKVEKFIREKKRQELVDIFQKTNNQQPPESYFFSPLHHAINSCVIDNIFETIPLLLPLIDYQLDHETTIDEKPVSNIDFFPAAKALATLRPPASVILQAMQAIVPPDKSASDDQQANSANAKKRLQLLTWILYQIEDNDAELTKFILQRKINNNEDKNGSFIRALKLLENPDELLPKAF